MPSAQTESISMRDLILKVKEYLQYLKRKWIIILVASVIGGISGALYAYRLQPKYSAELTFVLSTNASSTGGLAGLIGIGLETGAGNDLFSGENIIELLKTRKIVKAALFTKMPDTSAVLINYMLASPAFRKDWKYYDNYKFAFPFPNQPDSLSPSQERILSSIYGFLASDYIEVKKKDKKLSFYNIKVTCPDEKVSYYLCENIAAQAASFYIETKTKVAKQSLDMLVGEADSLKRMLSGVITAGAQTTDRTFNLNSAFQIQRSDVQQGQAKAQVLTTAYGEVLKNLEIAKINLQKEKPLYQIIEEPFFPLVRIAGNVLRSFQIGFFALLILSCFILFIVKLYKSILEDN